MFHDGLLRLQVATAQQVLPQLQQQVADAAPQLRPAQAEERQQGQRFAQQAPKLLQVAEALLQPVRDCQVAAQELVPCLVDMQAAVKAAMSQTEVCKVCSTQAVPICTYAPAYISSAGLWMVHACDTVVPCPEISSKEHVASSCICAYMHVVTVACQCISLSSSCVMRGLHVTQGSAAAQEVRASMTSLLEQLSKLQQHAAALQQNLAEVSLVVEENLQSNRQPAQSQYPARALSKPKRAALVLDATNPLLASVLERVCNTLTSSLCMHTVQLHALGNPWVISVWMAASH